MAEALSLFGIGASWAVREPRPADHQFRYPHRRNRPVRGRCDAIPCGAGRPGRPDRRSRSRPGRAAILPTVGRELRVSRSAPAVDPPARDAVLVRQPVRHQGEQPIPDRERRTAATSTPMPTRSRRGGSGGPGLGDLAIAASVQPWSAPHGPHQRPTPAFSDVLDAVAFDADGLVPAIAQQHDTGEVLMVAWMNRAALLETLSTGRVCYFSRSRNRLWRKGERSVNTRGCANSAWTATATRSSCSSSKQGSPVTRAAGPASIAPYERDAH